MSTQCFEQQNKPLDDSEHRDSNHIFQQYSWILGTIIGIINNARFQKGERIKLKLYASFH